VAEAEKNQKAKGKYQKAKDNTGPEVTFSENFSRVVMKPLKSTLLIFAVCLLPFDFL